MVLALFSTESLFVNALKDKNSLAMDRNTSRSSLAD